MEVDTGPAPNALCAYEGKARAAGNAHEINLTEGFAGNNICRFININAAFIT